MLKRKCLMLKNLFFVQSHLVLSFVSIVKKAKKKIANIREDWSYLKFSWLVHSYANPMHSQVHFNKKGRETLKILLSKFFVFR